MALVGIDLGTTNAVVATIENGRLQVLPNIEGRQTTPCVVFLPDRDPDNALVGDAAIFSFGIAPDRFVRFIRREMGRGDFVIRIDDQEYTPELISAAILKKLVKDAEEFMGQPVTDAVITVPAWFGEQERAATKRAGELAKLNVLALLPEPIAAVIACTENQQDAVKDKTFLVYHLGGATFAVSVVSVSQESGEGPRLTFRVLRTGGSRDLGGRDWDTRLAEHICQSFAEKNEGKNPADDPASFERLRQACQSAREILSLKEPGDSVEIHCSHEGITCATSVTRHEFEQMTESLLNETIVKTDRLVHDETGAYGGWDRIDAVLLDGGSARMPAVARRLEEVSGITPLMKRAVDLAAARGAAIYGFSPDVCAIKTGFEEIATAGSLIEENLHPRLPVMHSVPQPAPGFRTQAVSNHGAQATSRGKFDSSAAEERDIVDCTIYSPVEVRAGESMTVQVFVHIPDDADLAEQSAKSLDPKAEEQGATSLGTEISRGSQLTFVLYIDQGSVNPASQTLVWEGHPDSVRFTVNIAQEARPSSLAGKVVVSQDSIPVGTIAFDVMIVEALSETAEKARPAGNACRYKKAFISYASKDREEVLRRIQMLGRVGIETFFDLFSLKSGDVFAEKLFEYIPQSDVMFLFWSTAAKQSAWVEKEWRYGLAHKGNGYIQPVIIEGPPVPLPPPELEHLHFNDTVIYFVSRATDRGTSQTVAVEPLTNATTAVVEIHLPNGVRICIPANEVAALTSAIAAAARLPRS